MEDAAQGKARLAKAFFALLDRKPVDKISVSDICQEAGVSRQTFYRHFENKEDVAKWHFFQVATKSMYQVGRGVSWHDSIKEVYLMGQGTRRYISELFKGESYESVKMHAFRCRVESLEETVALHCGGQVPPQIDFQIRFFARAEVEATAGTLIQSVADADEYAAFMESCVPRELHDLLES